MVKRVILGAVVCALVSVTVAFAAFLNATTAAWNGYAGQFHFDTYPASASATFHSAYHGSNFEADFRGIWTAIGDELDDYTPNIPGGDDKLNATLENN